MGKFINLHHKPISESRPFLRLGFMILGIAVFNLGSCFCGNPLDGDNKQDTFKSISQAIAAGDVEQVEALLEQPGMDINAKDRIGTTLLWNAI